jgi:hypothetical protein
MPSGQPNPGECCCGRQAVTVFGPAARSVVGYCGMPNGGECTGRCPFCGGQRRRMRAPAVRGARPERPCRCVGRSATLPGSPCRRIGVQLVVDVRAAVRTVVSGTFLLR